MEGPDTAPLDLLWRRPELWVAAIVFVSFYGYAPFSGVDALGFQDDAFYYFTIARHLAQGHGFTFDGIHATNGFHPLWLFICAAVFSIAPSDDAALHAVVLGQCALLAITGALLTRTLVPRLGVRGAAAGGIYLAATVGAASVLRSGMESTLALFTLVCVWRAYLDFRADGDGAGRLGIWLALAFLARLELAVLVPVVLFLARSRLRIRPREVVLLAAPAVFAAIVYVAFNLHTFGVPFSISGTTKAVWASHMSWSSRLDVANHVPWLGQRLVKTLAGGGSGWTRFGMWSAVLFAAGVALAWRHALVSSLRRADAGLPFAAASLIVAVSMAATGGMWSWQAGPLILCGAILVAVLATRPALQRPLLVLMVVLALLKVPFQAYRDAHSAELWQHHRIEAGQWLALQDPEMRAASWNAGVIGFYSGGRVINLDGLANDRRFLREVVIGRRLGAYLREERVQLIADEICGDNRDAWFEAWMRPYRDTDPADWERIETFHAPSPSGCPGISIYRRRDARTPTGT